MSEKNAAFHRLAEKRVEALADQIRIFSNLSGPSYEWTADEVTSYFDKIGTALTEAMARFQEQKNWKLSADAHPTPEVVSAPDDEDPEPEPTSDENPLVEELHPSASKEYRRRRTIGQLIVDAQNDKEMLPEMVVFQREVIADLQRSLDDCRAGITS